MSTPTYVPEGPRTAELPSAAPAPPPPYPGYVPAPDPRRKTPILALFLSLFPGMGQVYNGQLAKAFFFFFALAGTITVIARTNEPLPFAFFIPFLIFWNLIDAYRSAVVINARGGEPVEEEIRVPESPAWGASLVALGVLLLLSNLNWISFATLARFWPVLLIGAGVAFMRGSFRSAGTGSTHGESR